MNKLEELEGECKLNIEDALNSFGHKCYKAGIREVVEWILARKKFCLEHPDEFFLGKEWQAKLKGWEQNDKH